MSQLQTPPRLVPTPPPAPPPPRGWWVPRRWAQLAAVGVLALAGLCAWLAYGKLFPGPPPQVILERQAAGLEVDQLRWQTLTLLPLQQLQQGQRLSAQQLAAAEANPDQVWLRQLQTQRWMSEAARAAARRLQGLVQTQLRQLSALARSPQATVGQELAQIQGFVGREVADWQALAGLLDPQQLLPETLIPLPPPAVRFTPPRGPLAKIPVLFPGYPASRARPRS